MGRRANTGKSAPFPRLTVNAGCPSAFGTQTGALASMPCPKNGQRSRVSVRVSSEVSGKAAGAS